MYTYTYMSLYYATSALKPGQDVPQAECLNVYAHVCVKRFGCDIKSDADVK